MKVDISKYTMERIRDECDYNTDNSCETCTIFDDAVDCGQFFQGIIPNDWIFNSDKE